VNAGRQEIELKSYLKNDEWWYGRGFSDQCFLIQPKDFKERIYNTQHPLANLHYPDYAGDSFEKRVYSYLISNNYYRITNKQTT
jgi:hypothetical protein